MIFFLKGLINGGMGGAIFLDLLQSRAIHHVL